MNYPSLKVMQRKWACEDWAGIIENYGENNLVSWLFRLTFDLNKIKRITAIYLTAKVATKLICKQDLKLIKSVIDIDQITYYYQIIFLKSSKTAQRKK